MNGELTAKEQRERGVREYLTFLKTLNKTSETYLYLLHLQAEKVWIFGDVEDTFDLGEKQEDGSYWSEQWTDSLHPKDRPYLLADVEKITAGTKDIHNLNYRVLTKNGKYTWVNCQGTVKTDEEGKPFFMVGRISETYLRHRLDPLTGLFNQEQLREDLELALKEKKKGVFMVIGIDNMKKVNTIRGRMVGDRYLQTLARTLEEEASMPKIYRVNGDVFAIFNPDVTMEIAEKFFYRIQKRVKESFTISAGAVPMDLPIQDISWLEQYSEFALGRAKEAGKDSLAIFTMEDYRAEEVSVALLDELIESVKHGCQGFSLVYQPQFKTGSYNLFGAEALLRYDSPSRGRVFPDEFIPLLERFELMYPVGVWVLKTALEQCKKWRKFDPDFHMSVNMSFSQLLKPEIRELVPQLLEQSGLPGDALTLEVTESMQLQNFQYYNDMFASWKDRGIEISVDDFGTGYSSLGYLKNLKVDEIKVDRCFVTGIHTNSYNYLLLKNIMELAEESQIRVCCEGVEETGELQVLEKMHPDLLQGYLFAKPCEVEYFEQQFFDTNSPEYQQHLSMVEDMEELKISGYLNMQHTEILRSVDMGLWMLRVVDEGKMIELYTDETMRRILGLKQRLMPEECYRYFMERICPGYWDYVKNSLIHMMKTGRVTRMQYFWNHPEKGREEVCGTGVRVEAFPGEICLQGYHRVISDIDDLRRGDIDVDEE